MYILINNAGLLCFKPTNRTVVNNSGWWRFLSLVGKITPWISQLYNFCFSRAINVFYPTMRQIILCLGDQTMRSMLSQELRLLSILLVAKMLGILISIKIKTPIIKTHFILWVKLGVRFCQLLAPSSTCLWWDLDVDEASSATVNQLTMISICLREQRRILEHEYYFSHQQQNPFCHCCNSIDGWKHRFLFLVPLTCIGCSLSTVRKAWKTCFLVLTL